MPQCSSLNSQFCKLPNMLRLWCMLLLIRCNWMENTTENIIYSFWMEMGLTFLVSVHSCLNLILVGVILFPTTYQSTCCFSVGCRLSSSRFLCLNYNHFLVVQLIQNTILKPVWLHSHTHTYHFLLKIVCIKDIVV